MPAALLTNIFSHSEGCLFILFMVSFAVQKLMNLIRSHLFLLLFLLPWETACQFFDISGFPAFPEDCGD